MIRTPPDSPVCPHCQKTFIRAEHLRRHVRSVHDEQGTVFRCGECDKGFNRADSCRRHEQSHHRQPQDRTVESMARVKAGDRIRRACRNCARARTKCSGGVRCTRCQSRDLTCTYFTRSNPRDDQRSPEVPQREYIEPDLQSGDQTPQVVADPAASPVVGEPFQAAQPGPTTAAAQDVSSQIQVLDVPGQAVDETFNWSDINWLPVADNVDFSLLFGVGFEPSDNESWQPVPVAAQQPGHHPELASPSSNTDGNTSSIGKASSLYADGYGARRSLQTIPKSPMSLDDDSNDAALSRLEFPARMSLPFLAASPDGPLLDAGVYAFLLEHFHLLCSRQSTSGRAFVNTTFPTSDHISRFLGLYLRHFDPDFPFVHSTTWWQKGVSWILVLAAVTVGSSHDIGSDSLQIVAAFREFLRRAIRWHLDAGVDCDPLPFAQASLLHAIGQAENRCPTIASAARHDLELAMELYESTVVLFSPDEIDLSQAGLKWQTWIAQESHFRLLWFSWLTKTLLAWLTTPERHVGLPEQQLMLPCNASLWSAADLESWVPAISRAQPPGNLLSALQSLFVKHRVPSPLSKQSEVLLTFIVLERADEVGRSTKQPLHAWSPGPGDDQSNEDEEINVPVSEPLWLPANPRYAAWRNSACDCFDVLHWKANADSTLARGTEGSLILHLHLVRLLLLCPYRSFIRLTMTLKKRPPTASRELPPAAQLEESILRWLTMDDHKGRLSLPHAGAIFWHLRRYARGHFYEPFSIYLASLVLWVYGVYLPQVRGNLLHIKQINATERAQGMQSSGGDLRSERSSEEADDDLTPKNILLDRPCDDEIVQVFVRRGYDMRADMSGAPDICLPSSQKVVLKEAIKLLRRPQYRHVGQSQTYRAVLQRVLQFS